ncbi:MAG: sigma 54-interacting transcriptional regulator, partial [Hydrococcus sp. CSU_1_8]|nr:sigma 54-interacting transcriptional regulator [Hydrococcus sp. CSU_1_8]
MRFAAFSYISVADFRLRRCTKIVPTASAPRFQWIRIDPDTDAQMGFITRTDINRVGGDAYIPVDVRILATSNRNMEEVVKKGQFREDLYFRLNVVKITIPPLRERPLDIDPLVTHFAKACAEITVM